MAAPSFGRWIIAAGVVLFGIALLERWDERIAYTAAAMILMALFFRYPAAWGELQKLVRGS